MNQTKVQLKEELAYCKESLDLHFMALNAYANKLIGPTVYQETYDGTQFRYHAWGLQRANGGYLLTLHRPVGERSWFVSPQHFEKARLDAQHSPIHLRSQAIACERALVKETQNEKP